MNRPVRVVALLVAAAVALTGCTASGTDSEQSGRTTQGGTLTVLTQRTEISLDPATSFDLPTTWLGLVTRRLTTWDLQPGKAPKIVPDLATTTGTPSDGGKTWTYTLKDGVTFQDGTPVTAADIKYGIERSFAAQLSGGLAYHKLLLAGGDKYTGPYEGKELPSIETPDAKTVVFHLNTAYGDWPWIAAMPAFSPVPKAKDNPQTYGKSPVATGPYQVKSNQNGTALTLVRNPQWKAATDSVRTAGPDTIVFKQSQNLSTSVQTLLSDVGDARGSFNAEPLGAAELALVNQAPDAKRRLVTSSAGSLTYLSMNTKRGALADVRVRQAIEYAVDRQAFMIAQGGKLAATPASTLITPGIPGRQEFDLYPGGETGDVAKAKALLQAAGHANGLPLTLWVANDTASQAQAQALQQGLKRAGITVAIKPLDQTLMYADATGDNPGYDLILSWWLADFPSASSYLEPLYASSQIGGGGMNLSRYSDPRVDALIAQARAEVDPAKSQALWVQIDKKVMQDAATVPLTYSKQSFLRGSRVENFYVTPYPAYQNYLTMSVGK